MHADGVWLTTWRLNSLAIYRQLAPLPRRWLVQFVRQLKSNGAVRVKVQILEEGNQAVFDALVAGVRAYNVENLGPETSRHLSVIARDDDGNLIGGVSGRTIYKHFLIEVVWVDKEIRGTGLGHSMMELAESEARKRGCVAAQVDTLSFQGPAFYGKLGFEVIGRVTGFPESADRYFMLKKYQ